MAMTWEISFYSGAKPIIRKRSGYAGSRFFLLRLRRHRPASATRAFGRAFARRRRPAGCPGQHIAGVEPHLRPIRDHSADTKDHVTEIGILTHFAVNR